MAEEAERLVPLAAPHVMQTQVVEGVSFAWLIAQRFFDIQALAEGAQRLLPLAPLIVDLADVVEGQGLKRPRPQITEERQRRLALPQRPCQLSLLQIICF